jgi:hypothetical protein
MGNGLKDRDTENIIRASMELPEIEEVILFGSRAGKLLVGPQKSFKKRRK